MIKNRVIKNASWIIACRVVQSILSFLIGMLTARYLGPANYGLINYASSVVAFVTPIMYLGLNAVLVQEIINNPSEEGKLLGTSIGMSLCSAVLCIIGVVAFTIISNPGEIDTLVIVTLYSLILVFQSIDLLQYWFQAKLMSKYTSIAMLVAYLFVSAYKTFLLITNKSLYWFAVSNSVDYVMVALLLLFFYRHFGKQPFTFSFSLCKRLLSRSKYYIISNLMVVIFTQTDKIMLKLMISDVETGLYSAAVTCAGITSFVFSAIIDSSRPSIFENRKNSIKNFENSISTLYCVVIYLALAQCLLMTILAKPIISIMYGNNYLAAIPVLQVAVWYTTFSYIGPVRGVWMLAEEKQKYLLIINIIGATSNVVMNYILIKPYGMLGAAIASIVTQLFTNVVIGYIIPQLRRNNELMLYGLNPKYIIKIVKEMI